MRAGVLCVMDEAGTPLKRAWCLLELWVGLNTHGPEGVHLLLPGGCTRAGEVQWWAKDLSMEGAETSVEDDKRRLVEWWVAQQCEHQQAGQYSWCILGCQQGATRASGPHLICLYLVLLLNCHRLDAFGGTQPLNQQVRLFLLMQPADGMAEAVWLKHQVSKGSGSGINQAAGCKGITQAVFCTLCSTGCYPFQLALAGQRISQWPHPRRPVPSQRSASTPAAAGLTGWLQQVAAAATRLPW